MTSAERLAILQAGIAVLERLGLARWAALPAPEAESTAALRAYREVEVLLQRLEGAVEFGLALSHGDDARADAWRDWELALLADSADGSRLVRLALAAGADAPYREDRLSADDTRALRALGELMDRYAAGAFTPREEQLSSEEPTTNDTRRGAAPDAHAT